MNIKKIIAFMIFAIMIHPALVSSKTNHQIIIMVPPQEDYVDGYQMALKAEKCWQYTNEEKCESYRACQTDQKDEFKMLFSHLGKKIYYEMNDSLAFFNQDKRATNKKIFYEKMSVVIPSCQYKKAIHKFYDSIEKTSFLPELFRKKKCNIIIWAKYTATARKTIKKYMDDPENKECKTSLHLFFYDGSQTSKKEVKLKFQSQYKSFSDRSIKQISKTIFGFLKQKHLIKTKEGKK